MVEVPADIIAVIKVRLADPTKPAVYDRIVDGLTRDLKKAAKSGEEKMFKTASRRLEANWSELTKRQQQRVLKDVGTIIEKQYIDMQGKTERKLKPFGRQIAEGTRKAHKKQIDPNISASLTSKDREFVNRVATSRAWFVRKHGGELATGYREDASAILSEGAEAGLSDKQIAKQLKTKLDNKTIQQSEHYYRTVANSAMNRARTWASLNSFREAGIRGYVYVSVLDESTTDICRFMHGRQFLVNQGIALMDKTEKEAMKNPEAVTEVTPYMQVVRDKRSGDSFMAFKRGQRYTRVARIDKSAVGQADKIGSYTQVRSDTQLQRDGFQFPPSHHLCRSMVEPIV